MQRIIIFANGELPDLDKARLLLHADDYIICADGGTRHALALNVRPNLIIGDMDSVEKEQLQKFKETDVSIELFSHDKNETDLELAITRAVERSPTRIIIAAALGGRLDHTLANISLLTDLRLSTFDIRLDDGVEEIFLCRAKSPSGDQVEVHGRSGDIVSLLAWQGAVSEVQTTNLKWALHKETLYPDKTRGVSNEMTDTIASISIGSGLLLILHRRQSSIENRNS
ncbi:MAG TPA: thiamine diphosphokinase [Anaerolineales bacterium]|nr:thiamine diphosphokinase [Anaerolineales bacterium]